MNRIIENQELTMTNVLHYQGWVTQHQVNDVFTKAQMLMEKNQANKSGDIVTATEAVEMRDGEPVTKLNVFIPLDKEIETSDGFDFIKQFRIENALKLRVEGFFQHKAEEAMKMIEEHMQNNAMQASTPACIVTVKAPTTPLEVESMVTDIYVGVRSK